MYFIGSSKLQYKHTNTSAILKTAQYITDPFDTTTGKYTHVDRSLIPITTVKRYRASSLCIIRRLGGILLEQFPEEDGVITFRPIGGTIEYGEDSKQAVVREVKEEINQDIIGARLLGIIENIFPYYDTVGHEFDFIYEAQFLNVDTYEQEIIEGVEGEGTYIAVWKNINDFNENPYYKLVPDGLFEMLTNETGAEFIHPIKHINTKDILQF